MVFKVAKSLGIVQFVFRQIVVRSFTFSKALILLQPFIFSKYDVLNTEIRHSERGG